ncbi:hypothetical protein KIW84_035431 [Lathyrus oleraceus]|uniref:Uncharacterized protein n=1 Tax=Pisum sativum TaxID=3888 RepID=A0A9D5B5N6_PEA|nr:hypothetical protein KIW84_035431 [Pisum sativum]
MDFIIRRFHQLSRRNKRFSSKSNGFRGSSSKDNIDDQRNCFNCKIPGHFRAYYSDLQKERSKKGRFQKDSFRRKLMKSIMATWDELDNEDGSNKDEGEENMALMAMTPSNIEYESTSDSYSYSYEEDKILSVVYGVLITITPTSIDNAINCEDKYVVLDVLFCESYLSPHIIFDNLSDLSKVSSLNSKALVWYHMLISNFLQKNKDLTSLDIYEQAFMLLLNSNLKINLPQVIFDYLKMTLTSFKEGKSCSISYGIVLYELFIQQGFDLTMTEVKSTVRGDKLKLIEALKVVDPFKVKVVSMD